MEDKPIPNPARTIGGEDVYIQYVTNKEEDNKMEEDGLDKLKLTAANKAVVKCLTCNGDHCTSNCPSKDIALASCNAVDGEKKTLKSMTEASADDPIIALRISNLSESTTDADLEAMVKPFGPVKKLYLEKKYDRFVCGYVHCGYVHFEFPEHAVEAIAALNGKTHCWRNLRVNIDYSHSKLKFDRCSTCNGDHCTSKCPWKDIALASAETVDGKRKLVLRQEQTNNAKILQWMSNQWCTSDTMIRVSNLSQSTTDADLEQLVKPFGPVNKLYLAKEKQTGQCRGFGCVDFKLHNDAVKAVTTLDGHNYDHLILNVELFNKNSSMMYYKFC